MLVIGAVLTRSNEVSLKIIFFFPTELPNVELNFGKNKNCKIKMSILKYTVV